MMRREGGCFCGAVRFATEGEPVVVTHCHCTHCRRTSGAAFVTWSEFPVDKVTFLQGERASFSSRPGVTRTFCPSCGSPLTYQSEKVRETVDLTTCSFDDPASFTPQDHLFCDRLLPWVRLDDGLPRYPTFRGGRS